MEHSFATNSEKSIDFMQQVDNRREQPRKQQHQSLIERLNRINRQTDEVLSRLESEAEKRNGSSSE